MTFAATLLVTFLRVYNPHDTAVDATIHCEGVARAIRVEARNTVDLLDGCAMATIEAPVALTTFETTLEDGVETQRLLGGDAACPAFAVEAPLFGCRLGTAAVAVPQIPGAAYAWSVEGASVVSGHGTNSLVLALGEGTSARVSATVTGECTSTAEAVISLRNPLVLEKFEVPANTLANTETTIQWSYANGASPASQLLTGEALDAPVPLAGDVRSYKFTPKTTGSKSIQLRASYAPAISVKPPRRRRATGPTRAIASECPSVSADAKIEVGGCGAFNTSIDAPENVDAGSTFTASIFLRTGETVKWTIDNGTILSGDTTDTVTVRASNFPGDLKLLARVSSGPNCGETSEARVEVVEPVACNTARPGAALTVENVSCNYATVKATFTGTPPFSGRWSDGTEFQTSNMTLTHDFEQTGVYTIRNLRDSLCAGDVSQTARVSTFGATATVSLVDGICIPGAKAVATFTGKPPFTGKWAYGDWFTTNEMSVEMSDFDVPLAHIEFIKDSECERYNSSNAIELQERPTASLRETSFCTTNISQYAILWVHVTQSEGAKPPFTAYWSDGEVTEGNAYSFYRTIVSKEDEIEVSLDRVVGTCEAIIDPERRTAVIHYREGPRIDTSEIVGCIGEPMTIRLKDGYHPDAQFEWSIDNGEILSGQGTPEITILQTQHPAARVRVDATFPDGRCSVFDHAGTILIQPGQILEFKVEPATIPVGGTTTIHFTIDQYIEWLSLDVEPTNRRSGLGDPVCTNNGRTCTQTFTDNVGAGPVDVIVATGNSCKQEERRIRLTVQ